MRNWIMPCVSLFLVVGALIYSLSGYRNAGLPERHRQVLKIGNQFSTDLVALARPFDELITKANGRIENRTSLAAQYNHAASIIGWVATGITVLITIMAAILGIDPTALKSALAPEQRRNKLLLTVTILAASSAALQLVDDRVQKNATQNREAAQHLFEETANARTRFANAGDSLTVAQEAKGTLEKALFLESLSQ